MDGVAPASPADAIVRYAREAEALAVIATAAALADFGDPIRKRLRSVGDAAAIFSLVLSRTIDSARAAYGADARDVGAELAEVGVEWWETALPPEAEVMFTTGERPERDQFAPVEAALDH